MKVLQALALPAVLIALAEVWARASGPSDAIAPPSAVAVALVGAIADGSLLADTGNTLVGAFGGLAIGAAIGFVLGLWLGAAPTADKLMELTVEVLRPIPSVAVIPVALVALGFGFSLEIAIVAFACVWPLLVLTRAAISANTISVAGRASACNALKPRPRARPCG